MPQALAGVHCRAERDLVGRVRKAARRPLGGRLAVGSRLFIVAPQRASIESGVSVAVGTPSQHPRCRNVPTKETVMFKA
jgi:hypothetical protein